MTNQHTHPPKKPKRSTDRGAGRKGRGTRASQVRTHSKKRGGQGK